VEGVLYEYPMKNIFMTAKFLPTWGFNQRHYLGFYLTKVPGWVKENSNIKVDM
jgi:hypothetical protein